MAKQTQTSKQTQDSTEFVFSPAQYKVLIIGICIVALGYILMSGGASDDPNVFNEAVFSFRRIRLAPTIVLAGFGVIIYAIFYKKTAKN